MINSLHFHRRIDTSILPAGRIIFIVLSRFYFDWILFERILFNCKSIVKKIKYSNNIVAHIFNRRRDYTLTVENIIFELQEESYFNGRFCCCTVGTV